MNAVPSDSDHVQARSGDEPVPLATASQRVAMINVAAEHLLPPTQHLLTETLRVLQPGGLLFIYGDPAELPTWGEYLLTAPEIAEQVVFKYWIALDLMCPTTRGVLAADTSGVDAVHEA